MTMLWPGRGRLAESVSRIASKCQYWFEPSTLDESLVIPNFSSQSLDRLLGYLGK